MIIDSHCHLDYEPMSSSIDNVILRAKKNHVKYLLTISTEDKNYSKILKIINKHNNVFGTYGIHPHEAKNHNEITSKLIIEKISLNKKIIGIGETGLDFYYNHSDKNVQRKLFIEHILASKELDLPLIIHSRAAEDDTYKILYTELKKKKFKFLIHCFTGTETFANKIIDIGGYISASGVVTFKKSKDLALIFSKLPDNKILVETDSPYLSPEPLRGKSNEPGNIIHTVKFLAKLRNTSFEDISNKTTENFFKLFKNLNE